MNALHWLADLYRSSPAARMVLRAAASGAAAYVVASIHAGVAISLVALAAAAGTAAGYAIIGLLTPTEPFVGVGKPSKVEVPVPPAKPGP